MDRDKEIALLEELQGLKDNGLFFLDDKVVHSPIDRYASAERFELERERIFRALPGIAAHSSELPEAGSFLTRDFHGLPLFLVRDRDGTARAFLNVCRHRGARLVGEQSGCKHSFSCPYHAWTWNSSGDLRGIPHEKPGFPDIDRDAHRLKSLPLQERNGLIWVVANPNAEPDFEGFLSDLDEGMNWMEMEDLVITNSDVIEREANWKLLVEGGIEAYHFKVAHRDTIGPHFMDNLSSYEMIGAHMRSVLPRTSLAELAERPRDDWSIRDVSNVLFTVLPSDQFLVMQDHVAWISATPVAYNRTRLRLTTLAHSSVANSGNEEHWKRNHAITCTTLNEDFDINEAVQAGIETGANDVLTFGRYEGALESFNAEVEKYLS